MFSTGFEVEVGSLKVDASDGAEAKCRQHFAETGNLSELK